MIKIVVICLFAITISSCSFYNSSFRDADRCTYSMVDPEVGTIDGAIKANEENWYVNSRDCERIQDDLGIKKAPSI